MSSCDKTWGEKKKKEIVIKFNYLVVDIINVEISIWEELIDAASF
jgi:hypothetical protein